MSQGNMTPPAQWRADGVIFSVAVSHDGTRVASGSGKNTVCVWDARTGALALGPLQGHTDSVRSVAFAPDDTQIISGSDDCTIRIWDVRTGTSIGEPLKGHTKEVKSVAISHDSARIVSSSNDETIYIWDARSGTPIGGALKGHTGYVTSVGFSHDSTRIVSGSLDYTVRIWDARTGAPIGEPLKGHTDPVSSVAFSHDSTHIVSGSSDKTIRIWNARTGTPIGEPLKGHTWDIQSVAFSHDSTLIVSGSFDDTVRIWDARTCTPIGEPLGAHGAWVNSVMFSPDSLHIFSGSTDWNIRVWQNPRITSPLDTTASQDSPPFDMVTSKMSAEEIFECLVKHGCTDLSTSIDPTRYSAAIAFGGFGDVLQAWTTSEVMLAVKCLRMHTIREVGDKGMKRLAREIHHSSKARHENIQELLGVVLYQGRLAMVSLWMHNGNLQQYIEKSPDVDRYPLCVQIAAGVAYMHGIGMVHGDLKAVNILVSADGVAKISDFDHSIITESTLRFSETTKIGGGTLRWMAPELLLDQGDDEDDSPPVMRSKQTDVYALGMTLLETISGKVPYHHIIRDPGIIRALMARKLPNVPAELSGPEARSKLVWNLLVTCWDHDPSARPEASSVLRSLKSAIA